MKIGVDIRVLMDRQYSGVAEYTSILLRTILKQVEEEESERAKYRGEDKIKAKKSRDKDSFTLFYNSYTDTSERIGNFDYQNLELKKTNYPNRLFNYFFQLVFSWPKIDRLIGGAEVFWSPHVNFTRLSKSTKHVLTIHDLSFIRYPEFFNRRKNIWHKALRVKKLANEATAIITVSENTRKDVIELLRVDPEKVLTIYSGVNPAVPLPGPAEEKNFFKQHDLGSRFILYLGTIEPRKNLAGLIYAYNRFRNDNIKLVDVQLVLAGAKGWRHRDIYRAWEESPYRQDIKFLGYVSNSEKELLYKRAELFIYPSYYEGFGLPVLEAMDRGLAVITSNVSSVPEVAGDAAIILNPYDISEIAKALELVINNPSLKSSLVEAGLEQAKKFSWENTAQKYRQLFKSL